MIFLFLVNKILSIGVILSQVFLVCAHFYFIFFRGKINIIDSFLHKNILNIIFIFSTVATLGSLFYSNIIGFIPCNLCWFQRIFMYPIVIICLVAIIKKQKDYLDYIIPLSVIGFLISLWHNYIYYNKFLSVVCDSSGISCVKVYVLEFGYITIPMMALTTFSVIAFISILGKIKQNTV